MRGRLAATLAALLLVAACSSSEPGPTKPTFGGPAPEVPASALASAKAEAGIEDCPETSGSGAVDLPDLTLECLGGGRPLDLAGLTGTPTVINFWASWCRPCRDELPVLARAHDAYGDRVRFVGVDFRDPAPDDAIELARRSGVTYPLVADPDEDTRVPFRLVALPQTVFVDAEGRVVATERKEFRTDAELAAAVRRHLGVTP